MSEPLWRPSAERVAASQLTQFMRFAAVRSGRAFPDSAALWRWSVEDIEGFWDAVWDFCGIVAETKGGRVLADAEKMPGARFFPEARLNFAENLLREDLRKPGDDALVFWGEDRVKRRLSHRAIRGTYGDASAILSVRRHSGSVVITKK